MSFAQQLNDLEIKMRRQIEAAEERAIAAALAQASAAATAASATAPNFAAVVNYLPNSHPEYSKDGYLNANVAPNSAGDANRECYNWFRQPRSETVLAASAARALKRSVSGAEHSLWAANEAANTDIPVWDGVNGWFRLGSGSVNYDIACPLPTDFVGAGGRYFFGFEAALDSSISALPADLQISAEFFDNTTGQNHTIQAAPFTPMTSVFGAAGARELRYRVLAQSDAGAQILSNEVTVAGAPANLSPNNHVRLSFAGAPGFVYFAVYRFDAAANSYRFAGEIRNSSDLQFFDQNETSGALVAGYPTVSTAPPQARAVTTEFAPGVLGASGFVPHSLLISVPSTYNRGATAPGNQWLRFGATGALAPAAARAIIIRRVFLSEGYGVWTRGALDLNAKSGPTTTAAVAPPSGGGVYDPPPSGGGGRIPYRGYDPDGQQTY